MKALLDTSILIAGDTVSPEYDAAISAISICELHYGLLTAQDETARATRAAKLGDVEAQFPAPLPIDGRVAREWGRLQAAVVARGGKVRRRNSDLAIAATANVRGAVLITHNIKDFEIIKDLVAVRVP